MSNASKFFDKVMNQFSDGLHTCVIAKIESYDPVKMKASVQPLNKVNYNGKLQSLPLIPNVPVSFIKAGNFFIRPPYQKGDLVLVAFAEHDIDYIMLTGNEESSNSQRKHSIDDAIVINGIMPFSQSMPSENANDLLIAKSDMTIKIIIGDNGIEVSTVEKDINLSTDSGNINISSSTGNVNISGKDSSGSW
ncbi:Gp138 family membrane-puncturing spike protein [Anaerosolibacter sp.]|uniref:Gp138 family membrane-puncturing spike protein n=1 Tax=Anaerosolibacter sp. TaxID=1872527 RepID=UPI0039EE6BA4